MDNFRGFKDTYLPLKDVNFFVGENSTGKTSVMALLSMLSSPKFWETFDFSTEFGIDLGLFNDINSQTNEFSIGFFTDEGIGNLNLTTSITYIYDEIPDALLMTFIRNLDGTAKISKFYMYYSGRVLHIRNEGNAHYYSKNHSEYFDSEEAFISLLSSSNDFSDDTYQVVSNQDEYLFTPFSIYRFATFFDRLKKVNKSDDNIRLASWLVRGISLMKKNIWIAPIRSKPLRIYERTIKDFSPEGEHIPFVIKELSESGSAGKIILEQIDTFGKLSGLFDKLTLKKYGNEKNAPFEIQVEVGGDPHKITNVGYGVSQVLPFIVDILTRKDTDWFLIQQPEVHLHPKAQSSVGEFIYQQASLSKKKFIIETHSDFLIDRFRLTLKKSKEKIETQVVYFQHSENGNTIRLLPIDDEGRYPEDQPSEFREFFINEAIEMMEV